MSLMRLQKILAFAGVCSRRKAEFYISDGSVTVNDRVIKVLGAKADLDVDRICVNGNLLTFHTRIVYIVLNKPRGFVSSCHQTNVKTVTDLINISGRLFPVGRLDKNSSGLLLMTNDGRIHHRLLHPSFGHEKEYHVETLKPVSSKFLGAIRNGVVLNGKITLPAKVSRISSRKFKVVLIEGRNRQIRRVVEQLKNKVLALKRVRVNNIKLGSLREGKWRYLRRREKDDLIRSVELSQLDTPKYQA